MEDVGTRHQTLFGAKGACVLDRMFSSALEGSEPKGNGEEQAFCDRRRQTAASVRGTRDDVLRGGLGPAALRVSAALAEESVRTLMRGHLKRGGESRPSADAFAEVETHDEDGRDVDAT
jgi:hypothetical protein